MPGAIKVTTQLFSHLLFPSRFTDKVDDKLQEVLQNDQYPVTPKSHDVILTSTSALQSKCEGQTIRM